MTVNVILITIFILSIAKVIIWAYLQLYNLIFNLISEYFPLERSVKVTDYFLVQNPQIFANKTVTNIFTWFYSLKQKNNNKGRLFKPDLFSFLIFSQQNGTVSHKFITAVKQSCPNTENYFKMLPQQANAIFLKYLKFYSLVLTWKINTRRQTPRNRRPKITDKQK